MGDGPYRVWKNRREGVDFTFGKKLYNNTITGIPDLSIPSLRATIPIFIGQ